MEFAPVAFRNTRLKTTVDVEAALKATDNLTNIKPSLMRLHPEILPTLRMSTCPPIAVDRLIGLAGLSPRMVKAMELYKRLPVRMSVVEADAQLAKIGAIIERLADPDQVPVTCPSCSRQSRQETSPTRTNVARKRP